MYSIVYSTHTWLGVKEKLVVGMEGVGLEGRRGEGAEVVELEITLLATESVAGAVLLAPAARKQVQITHPGQAVSRVTEMDHLFPIHQLRGHWEFHRPRGALFLNIMIIMLFSGFSWLVRNDCLLHRGLVLVQEKSSSLPQIGFAAHHSLIHHYLSVSLSLDLEWRGLQLID